MISKPERHDTDILIIGSGGAGLFAALHAQQSAPEGTKITLAVKGLIGKCGCTRMVQGGYNVALGGGDTVERHFMDTINGGKWLPNQDMAWRLCEEAVVRVRELENEIGCFFDREADGQLHAERRQRYPLLAPRQRLRLERYAHRRALVADHGNLGIAACPPQCVMNTGTGDCWMKCRDTPPNSVSRSRLWLNAPITI